MRTSMRMAMWGAIGVIGIAACGGGTSSVSSGGSGTGFARSEQSYCDAREARSKSCVPDGAAPPPFSRANCAEDHQCALALLAFPDTYFECRSNPDCAASAGDDSCIGKSAQGRSVAQSDLCAKKAAECKVAGGKGFDDDTCGLLAALTDASLQKVYACIEKSCEQISECIESTVKAISPACD